MRHWSGHSWMVFYRWRWRLSSEIFLLSRLRVSLALTLVALAKVEGNSVIRRW
jgi:hypothetical protein